MTLTVRPVTRLPQIVIDAMSDFYSISTGFAKEFVLIKIVINVQVRQYYAIPASVGSISIH